MQVDENLRALRLIGESAYPFALLTLLQFADAALTLSHSLQEWKGRLADYFGAIIGVRIPKWIGFVGFFAGLTVALWFVGVLAIGGAALWPNSVTVAALGFLCGCRLSDGVFSHVRLHLKGFRPNPGLTTVPLYFAEVVFLAVVFQHPLFSLTFPAGVGFLMGAAAFYFVLPVLDRIGRNHWPRREKWQPGTPRPT